MVVIGLCGLQGCGKREITDQLIKEHGFTVIRVNRKDDAIKSPSLIPLNELQISDETKNKNKNIEYFSSIEEAVNYVTSHWKNNFVTEGLEGAEDYYPFMCRPFFMVIAVLAPLQRRYDRCRLKDPQLTLEQLVKRDDELLYGEAKLINIIYKARLTISNGGSLEKLVNLIRNVHFDDSWTRPQWDEYFMEMAELVSRRSNCMKRVVGAVIVKDKRVVSTGYNGTAKGLTNCCDGGCPRCNSNARCGVGLDLCYCIHAEENALLEVGRIGCNGATLYCTSAPCVGCSKKLIQCGIKRIVFMREYSIEHNAHQMYKEAQVELVKFTHQVPHYLDAETFDPSKFL